MTRVVRKYPNRRLYDTQESRYVTLDGLREMIAGGEARRVEDAKSGEDRTREVLLQIVAEQETLGQPILNEAVLVALIRIYGHPMQQMASRSLETALSGLQRHGDDFARSMEQWFAAPGGLAADLSAQNARWMEQMQEAMAAALGGGRRSGSQDDDPPEER